jgi:outer membrane protein
MPLLDGGDRRGAVRQAEIALEQSHLSEEMQRQQIIREIRNSVRDAGETERQIEIRRTALEVAERQHQVEDARFQLGIGDSQELLDAQTSVTSARIAFLTSIINYQRALGELRMTTMADPSQLVANTAQ